MTEPRCLSQCSTGVAEIDLEIDLEIVSVDLRGDELEMNL
jgi:hypothetical protein